MTRCFTKACIHVTQWDDNIGLDITKLTYQPSELTTLPSKVYQMPLTYLCLQQSTFDHNIGKLVTLQALHCSAELVSVPNEINLLIHLTRLDLDSNKLADLPELCLVNLLYLKLSKNRFSTFPRIKCDNLEHLDLSFNRLSVLPEINNLTKLKSLSLSYNQLSTLPNLDLPKLRILTLKSNRLTELPPLILPKLSQLCIEENRLRYLPHLTLPKLEYLLMAHNPIVQVYYKHGQWPKLRMFELH